MTDGVGVAAAMAFGIAGATALVVCAGAWAVSRGRLHRSDRVGAAAIAVGFVVGYQGVTGGGWHPERPVTWLPLVAVIGALFAPRVAGRAAPGAKVPAAARVFVVVAAVGAAAAMFATGRGAAAALELAVLGAVLGSAAGERLAGPEAGDGAERGGAERGGAERGGAERGGAERGGAEAGVANDSALATGPDRRIGAWVLAALLVGLIPAVAA